MNHNRKYIADLQKTLDQLPVGLFDEIVAVLHEARLHGRQILVMGNGGSASTASHFVADLNKNTRSDGLPGFRAICLADNMALLSAYANDEGYVNVFAQQLANFVRPYDVVIAVSASGSSPNVIKAIELAKHIRAKTIGFTGNDGGMLGKMVDLHLNVPSSIIEHIEDVHLMAEHLICKTLREFSPSPQTPELISQIPGQVIKTSNALEKAPRDSFSGPSMFALRDYARSSVELLYSISRELDSSHELQEVLQRVLSLTIEHIGASSGSILILDEKGEINESVLTYAGQVLTDRPIDDILDKGLARWVIENQQAALVSSTLNDPRWLPRVWDRSNGNSRSAVSVPLMENNRVIGVMTLVHSREGKFTYEHLTLLTAIAVCISFIGFRPMLRARQYVQGVREGIER